MFKLLIFVIFVLNRCELKQKRDISEYKAIFYFVLTPLLLGVVIYSIARDESIYFLKFFRLNFFKIPLPYWVQYHLPDGLWAFAFSSLLAIVWGDVQAKAYRVWLIILISVSLLLEVFYGTFDWYDVVFIALGIAIPWGIFRKVKVKSKSLYI